MVMVAGCLAELLYALVSNRDAVAFLADCFCLIPSKHIHVDFVRFTYRYIDLVDYLFGWFV